MFQNIEVGGECCNWFESIIHTLNCGLDNAYEPLLCLQYVVVLLTSLSLSSRQSFVSLATHLQHSVDVTLDRPSGIQKLPGWAVNRIFSLMTIIGTFQGKDITFNIKSVQTIKMIMYKIMTTDIGSELHWYIFIMADVKSIPALNICL